jgi:hypothetical protein
MTDYNEDLDFTLLPNELRQLAPFVRRFGLGDDVERGSVVSDASTDDLRNLFEAANPHFDALNIYIEDNMQPPGPRQDLAIALGDFAQAALEAELELRRRQTTR